jgi:hypothetical protein
VHNGKNNGASELGLGARSVQSTVQQARLRGFTKSNALRNKGAFRDRRFRPAASELA